MALSVPLSRFTSQVGGGSAFFVRHHFTHMKTSHIFGLVVRTTGLIIIVFGFIYILDGFVILLEPTFRSQPMWHYFIDGAMLSLVGLFLLRGAPHVVRFAYPNNSCEKDTSHDA